MTTETVGQPLNGGEENPPDRSKNPYEPRIAANVRSGELDFPTIPESIAAWAQRTPDKIALLSTGRAPIDYAGLVEQAHCIRHALESNVVTPPMRVALCIEDRPSLAICLIALMFHGSPVIPVDPAMTEAELERYLVNVRADAVVTITGENTMANVIGERLGLTVIEFVHSNHEFSLQFSDDAQVPERTTAAPKPAALALLLSTSGTTERKIVPKSHGEWAVEVTQRAKWLGLGPQDRCLNMLPLYLSQGIHEGLLAPLISGGSTIITAQSNTEAFFACLEAYSPNWFYAVYTSHRDILAQAPKYEQVIQNSSLSFVKAGGMRFPQAEVAKVEALFNAPLVVSYGSTEAGYITCTPLPPQTRKADAVGLPVIDELKLIDAHGASVESGQTGEVVVRGPGVMKGYLDDPDANAKIFVDGWLRTGDEGFLDSEGFLHLTGRIKDIINCGGRKISPTEIDDALLAHPQIIAAAAFPIPHATLGEEVAAAVVPAKDSALTVEILKSFMAQHLAPYKIPRRIVFVDALPQTASGKIQRQNLACSLGLDGTKDVEHRKAASGDNGSRPASTLEAKLQEIWAATLGLESVGLHDDYFSLGGDSLQAVEMFLRVEEALGCQLPRSILIEASTVAEMVQYIEDAQVLSCLVSIQPKGDLAPFFCVHDIDGDIFHLHELALLMGEVRPFYGIRNIGPDGRKGKYANMESMATHYVRELRKLQPAGPYFLGGYSFGGKAAYVMAQQLQAAGEEVALLALMDTFSGNGSRNLPMPQWIAQHFRVMAEQSIKSWPNYVLQRAHRNAVLIGQSLKQRTLSAVDWSKGSRGPLRKQHYSSDMFKSFSATYQLKPYSGDAVLFKADLDIWSHPDSQEGWHRLIEGNLTVIPVSGGHWNIIREPYVQELANKLSSCLAE
jgi:acyl-CoA synthetase (AMP-forming)/AMP-acid ligase II/thioesterase domain-containing protein/acyl carrier protein